ncbi:MAG TPA: response regulator transcription factor [Gemmatimonadales bacterium]|nr:response regulator transcription factor [Gemmatimonadales bacterium]
MTADHGEPIVFVVDDDPAVCEALSSLLRAVGLRAQTFRSAHEFVGHLRQDAPACVVLDVRLPGLSGLDLQRDLMKSGAPIPIIFLTGHGDVPMSVQAMKAGAVEFLTKPFRDQQLLDAIHEAIARDRTERTERAERDALRQRYESLSPREREVMAGVVDGRLNKQIAAALGITEITVKVQRARMMKKMRAESLADLIRTSERLRLPISRQ